MPHVVSAPTECKMALRDYQEEPAKKILEALKRKQDDGSANRVLAVAPVGFGKTVLFSYVASQYAARGEKVLIIAHREELLEQISSKVGAFGLTSGLEKAQSRVDELSLPDVTVASVQTLRGKRLERFSPDTFALIVVDEAHHCRKGDQYAKVFSHLSAAPVLGVTGTPKRLDGEALGNVFKEVAFTIGLDEGINAGWLCEPELVSYRIKGYKLDTLRTIAGEYSAADIERELLVSPTLHAAANIICDVAPGRRTLVFSPTVRAATELSKELCRRGLRALAVSGEMATVDRKEATRRYRAGEVDIAVNCMLWTEGFDVPETDCVVLLRPTKSTALMTQMIGRGLRLHPGKTSCLLVEIEPETVTSKLFAKPEAVLLGSKVMKKQEKKLYDAEGEVKPGAEGIIDSLEMDADVEKRAYAELMKKYRPSAAAIKAMKELGLTEKQIKAVTDVEHIKWWNAEKRRRMELRLCTIKQANLLLRFGLNGEMSFTDAQYCIGELARVSFKRWEARHLIKTYGAKGPSRFPSAA